MRSSSIIFRAIRMELFRLSQAKFGKKLGLSKVTIGRLERRKHGHHVSAKHWRLLRDLPAPPGEAERKEAMLDELAKAIEEESKPEGYLEAEQRRQAEEAKRAEDLQKAAEAALRAELAIREMGQVEAALQRTAAEIERRVEEFRQAEEIRRQQNADTREATLRRAEELAQRAEGSAQRADQLRLAAESIRAQADQHQEELVLRALEAIERAEKLRFEMEATRAQASEQFQELLLRAEETARRAEQLALGWESRRVEMGETVRRAEEAAARAEQLREDDEVRLAQAARRQEEGSQRVEGAVARAEDAATRAEQTRAALADEVQNREQVANDAEHHRALERRRVKWLLVTTVIASVVLSVGGVGAIVMLWLLPHAELIQMTRATNFGPGAHEPLPAERESASEEGEDETLSAGLDGGTQWVKLVNQALPMPKGALHGQMVAPCPEVAEEMNGYCWKRIPLTPADVRAGACDSLRLYEPSEGWCRANHAGYKPWYGTKRSNSVEPQ